MNQRNPSIVATTAVAARSALHGIPNLWTLPRSVTLDWSYPAAAKRDLRLDILRGFAVIVMIIDHFGGSSWLYLITGGNAFFVSGAEAFIFISGLVVGMVYGAIALKQGIWAAQKKALSRAWTLYKLTVVLTLVFAAFSVAGGLDWAKELQIGNPFVFALNVATLRQTMYLTDIALMYTLLMVLAAAGLWLLFTGRTKWLLAGSSALWLAFQWFRIQVPWSVDGNTTFNLAAWQLLFFVAMAVGYHRRTLTEMLGQVPRWPYLLFSALLVLLLVQFYDTNGHLLEHLVPGVDIASFMSAFFLKSSLGAGRLIASLIIFQFAYLMATLFWKPIGSALGWLLLPLGQNALYAYTMHVVITGAFHVIFAQLPIDLQAMGTVNTSLQLLVILGIWAMIQQRFLFRVIPR